jgi:hypothetical protein
MSQDELNQQLAALEGQLTSFHPAPSRLDRDRVMFLAGRASGENRPRRHTASGARWLWPMAFAGMSGVAATLLVTLLWRPAGVVDQATKQAKVEPPPAPTTIVIVDRQPEFTPALGPKWQAPEDGFQTPYFRQLDQILAKGPDTWAATVPTAADPARQVAPPPSYPRLLNALIEVPPALRPPAEYRGRGPRPFDPRS